MSGDPKDSLDALGRRLAEFERNVTERLDQSVKRLDNVHTTPVFSNPGEMLDRAVEDRARERTRRRRRMR